MKVNKLKIVIVVPVKGPVRARECKTEG